MEKPTRRFVDHEDDSIENVASAPAVRPRVLDLDGSFGLGKYHVVPAPGLAWEGDSYLFINRLYMRRTGPYKGPGLERTSEVGRKNGRVASTVGSRHFPPTSSPIVRSRCILPLPVACRLEREPRWS